MTAPLRVLLADDHPSFLDALATILSLDDRIDVVAAARHGGEAVELATTLRPDVVLIDLHMPVLDGLEATRRIGLELPFVRVVMLTASHSADDRERAAAAGVTAYLTKDRLVADVASTVLDVAASAKQSAA